MLTAFSRTEMLLGADGMARLGRAHVAVFGAGAVGGYAIEALVRSGVGALDIYDDSLITEEKVGLLVHAGYKDIGRYAAETAAERAKLISPGTDIGIFREMRGYSVSEYSYIIDTAEDIALTVRLAMSARRMICVPRLCGCQEVSALTTGDIGKIKDAGLDGLRYKLRKNGIKKLCCVYSETRDGSLTAPHVLAAAGLIAAGAAIRTIAEEG